MGYFGLASGKASPTSGMKDVVKNLTDAEDKLRKVWSKEFHCGRLDGSVRGGPW